MVKEDLRTTCGPDAVAKNDVQRSPNPAVVKVFPHRSSVPADLWGRLLEAANDRIEIPLSPDYISRRGPVVHTTIKQKAATTARRFDCSVGDPAADERRSESSDERLAAAPFRHASPRLSPLSRAGLDRTAWIISLFSFFLPDTRVHSVFGVDDEMIVNMSVTDSKGPTRTLRAPPPHGGRRSSITIDRFERLGGSKPSDLQAGAA